VWEDEIRDEAEAGELSGRAGVGGGVLLVAVNACKQNEQKKKERFHIPRPHSFYLFI
jgi:hypothetical protein